MTGSQENIKEPEGPLFHYTSIQGLIGIFAERNIWATSIYHLNDKEELFRARDMFLQRIEALRKGIDSSPQFGIPPPGYKEDLRIRFLNTLSSLLGLAEEFPIFVCSFSEAGDQLSQWRGYCPNACGFSIGFNYPQLKEQIDRQKFMLKKCIYDERQQRDIIDQYIETHVASVLPSLIEGGDTRGKVVNIFIEILQILPIIKSEYFEEEKEWRLISSIIGVTKRRMKFRPGKTAVIPYYEFKLTNKVK